MVVVGECGGGDVAVTAVVSGKKDLAFASEEWRCIVVGAGRQCSLFMVFSIVQNTSHSKYLKTLLVK